MKRILVSALLSLAFSLGAVGSAASAPAPTYTAVLTVDSSCFFTLKASWTRVAVAKVYGFWYYDDRYVFTTDAPGTSPNSGTINGRTATMNAGPVTVDTVNHSWKVLVQFYSRAGAQLASIDSNVVSAPCSVALP